MALLGFKQSDLARFGIDWERARTINPRLVHLTHTPFGTDGPDAEVGGYDTLVQGRSGAGFVMNRTENGTPIRFSAVPNVPYGASPGLGQHTREVMDELGFTDDETARLEAAGVLGATADD